jgi:sRNA-binding regulator protein Hfq
MSSDSIQGYVYDLVGLSGAYFGKLSEAETKLLTAAQSGGVAFCGSSIDLSDPSNDPEKSSDWGKERSIRANLIRWLCLDQTARDRVNSNGIRVCGANLIERLSLSYATIPFGLTLMACRLVEDADLVSASLTELDLRGSWIRSLNADSVNIKGGVFLSLGFRAQGVVRLPTAQIGTDLSCESASFTNPSGVALNADGVTVKRNVFFRENFRANGEVRLLGAQIGGNLECDGAMLKNGPLPNSQGSGIALHADRVTIGGYALLRNGFTAEGEVMLLNAEIGANLDCQNALMENPPKVGVPRSGAALSADGIRVKGNAVLSSGFRARGEVRLRGAHIGGNLDCENGVFANPSRMALDADRIRVNGYVFLRNGFSAEGEVKLLNAEIGSNLECDNAKLKNPQKDGAPGSGNALVGDSAKVAGYIFLRNGFSAEGQVNFQNSQIGSDLQCGKATFKNPSQNGKRGTGLALCLDGAKAQGTISLDETFSAEGNVQVCHAQIGGHLICDNAKIDGTFIAQATSVAGALFWTNIIEPELAELDIVNTHVDALVDDRPSWPESQKLKIDGLEYERFSSLDTPKSASSRLDWLSRQKNFAPQPYRQVAKVLRNNGDDAGARRVLSEMERLRRKNETANRNYFIRFLASAWGAILRATIGYGFHPARSLFWLAGLTALGTILFTAGYAVGSIAPNDKDAYIEFTSTSSLPPHYEHFSPFIYSLENSFPLIRFGQADHWQPVLDAQQQATPKTWIPQSLSFLISPRCLRRFRWLQICLGWFFTTMGVAAVTGIVRKE